MVLEQALEQALGPVPVLVPVWAWVLALAWRGASPLLASPEVLPVVQLVVQLVVRPEVQLEVQLEV